MKIYMLVDSTKYELPLDVDLSLKKLAIRWDIPYQTARNRLSDGKSIKYLNARLEALNIAPRDIYSTRTGNYD